MNARTVALLILSVAAAPAGAQQSPDSTTLRPVVVTATRVPVARDAAPASVSVLRGEDLRLRGIVTVADALAEVPGIAVVRSGSFGATTSLFMRGGESDYVKVMIDGVAVNAPGGTVDLASMTTDNLDRIEVVRGPASVVYGSDAVAGVVQLFTRRGAGAPRGWVDARGGSFGTLESSAGLGGGAGPMAYSLGVAARESDGIYAFNNRYRNRTASGRVSFTPGRATVDLSARRTDATYHFPTDGAGHVVDSNAVHREHRTVLALDAAAPLTRTAEIHLLAGATRLDGGSANQPDSPGDSTGFYGTDDGRTERRTLDLRVDVHPRESATLSLGATVAREQLRSTSESRFQTSPPISEMFAAHRTTNAAYAQLVARTGVLTYTASGRLDDDATYGTFVTGRGSLALRVGSGTSVRAAVGNAFKAPAFEETFSSSFTIGNPDLQPERTLTWEAAAEHQLGRHVMVRATYFDQRFRDLIQYVGGDASTNFRGTNENLGAATARGVELEARAMTLGAVDLGANVTLLQTRVTDAGNGAFGTFVAGERLLRRPVRTATLTAGYRVARGSTVGAALRLVGERDDRDFANEARVSLGGYGLLDLHADLSLTPLSPAARAFSVTLRVENLLDHDYEPAFGFAAPGRMLLVGLRAGLGGR